jgi:galactoside O-acetyltransferase
MTPQPYTRAELETLGVRCGENVQIDRSVVLINPQRLSIGHDVRIDCFCVLSAGPAGIELGSWIHLACGCYLFGSGGPIQIEDFANVSSRVSIYTANDDYVGGALTNPLVPYELRDVTTGPVHLQRHAIIGSGSVLLPGVTLGVGAAVGALSLVADSVPDFTVVAGTPARRIRQRGRQLLELEQVVRERFASSRQPT